MSKSLFTTILSVLLAAYTVNAAVVSLYVPLVQSLPGLSADVLGTDGAGHTTWRLSPTGTFTASTDFPTATLVEGASDAHLELPGTVDIDTPIVAHIDCAIQDGVSNCTAVGVGASVTTTLFTAEETVNAFAVQVANSASSKNAAKGPRMVGSSLLVATGAMVMGIVLCTA